MDQTASSLSGAGCISSHSPVWRPTRRQGEIASGGFTEHTQRQKTRDIDILRYANFVPQRSRSYTYDQALPSASRSSSCPPAIRQAEYGGSAVQQFAAGLSSRPQERQQGRRKVQEWQQYGQTTMASYLQYNAREQIEAARDRRVSTDTGFAQKCRDLVKVSSFAGRVAQAVMQTSHNSNSDGVRGCFQW